MENSKPKKTAKSEMKKSSSDFYRALRSSGMLLPITDEEIESFNKSFGNLNEELPEKFQNLDFIFGNIKSREMPNSFVAQSAEIRLAYAARDGQENLPDHILNKMKDLKAQGRKKNTRNSTR